MDASRHDRVHGMDALLRSGRDTVATGRLLRVYLLILQRPLLIRSAAMATVVVRWIHTVVATEYATRQVLHTHVACVPPSYLSAVQ